MLSTSLNRAVQNIIESLPERIKKLSAAGFPIEELKKWGHTGFEGYLLENKIKDLEELKDIIDCHCEKITEEKEKLEFRNKWTPEIIKRQFSFNRLIKSLAPLPRHILADMVLELLHSDNQKLSVINSISDVLYRARLHNSENIINLLYHYHFPEKEVKILIALNRKACETSFFISQKFIDNLVESIRKTHYEKMVLPAIKSLLSTPFALFPQRPDPALIPPLTHIVTEYVQLNQLTLCIN